MSDAATSEMFNELCGEALSSVTFVSDYLQLWFNGPGINVFNPLTVRTGEINTTSWQVGFRDALCAQISKTVASVSLTAGEALTLHFAGGSSIAVSLRMEDYASAEAIYAHGFRKRGWVVL